jgi:hypothetical protein
MKVNFELKQNACWDGLGEILTFWPKQTSTLGVFSQGTKHGWVMTLSGVELKNK